MKKQFLKSESCEEDKIEELQEGYLKDKKQKGKSAILISDNDINLKISSQERTQKKKNRNKEQENEYKYDTIKTEVDDDVNDKIKEIVQSKNRVQSSDHFNCINENQSTSRFANFVQVDNYTNKDNGERSLEDQQIHDKQKKSSEMREDEEREVCMNPKCLTSIKFKNSQLCEINKLQVKFKEEENKIFEFPKIYDFTGFYKVKNIKQATEERKVDINQISSQILEVSEIQNIQASAQTVMKIYTNFKNSVFVKLYYNRLYNLPFIAKSYVSLDVKDDNIILREVKILEELNRKQNKVTLQYYGYNCMKVENANIHTIYMESGMKSLWEIYLISKESQDHREYLKILEYAFCQLLNKLNKLHSENQIAHSDIKPQNIVLGHNLKHFYFIDFGESIYLNDKSEYGDYLSGYTPFYNLQENIRKRQSHSWVKDEIINCDISQLILSFLWLLILDDNDSSLQHYHQLRNNLVFDTIEAFRKNIIETFHPFADYLFDCLVNLHSKNKATQLHYTFIFSEQIDRIGSILQAQQDIIYNDKSARYQIKQINSYSIKILNLLSEHLDMDNFDFSVDTIVLEEIDPTKENKRDISSHPHFCERFGLKKQDIWYLAETSCQFREKYYFWYQLTFKVEEKCLNCKQKISNEEMELGRNRQLILKQYYQDQTLQVSEFISCKFCNGVVENEYAENDKEEEKITNLIKIFQGSILIIGDEEAQKNNLIDGIHQENYLYIQIKNVWKVFRNKQVFNQIKNNQNIKFLLLISRSFFTKEDELKNTFLQIQEIFILYICHPKFDSKWYTTVDLLEEMNYFLQYYPRKQTAFQKIQLILDELNDVILKNENKKKNQKLFLNYWEWRKQQYWKLKSYQVSLSSSSTEAYVIKIIMEQLELQYKTLLKFNHKIHRVILYGYLLELKSILKPEFPFIVGKSYFLKEFKKRINSEMQSIDLNRQVTFILRLFKEEIELENINLLKLDKISNFGEIQYFLEELETTLKTPEVQRHRKEVCIITYKDYIDECSQMTFKNTDIQDHLQNLTNFLMRQNNQKHIPYLLRKKVVQIPFIQYSIQNNMNYQSMVTDIILNQPYQICSQEQISLLYQSIFQPQIQDQKLLFKVDFGITKLLGGKFQQEYLLKEVLIKQNLISFEKNATAIIQNKTIQSNDVQIQLENFNINQFLVIFLNCQFVSVEIFVQILRNISDQFENAEIQLRDCQINDSNLNEEQSQFEKNFQYNLYLHSKIQNLVLNLENIRVESKIRLFLNFEFPRKPTQTQIFQKNTQIDFMSQDSQRFSFKYFFNMKKLEGSKPLIDFFYLFLIVFVLLILMACAFYCENFEYSLFNYTCVNFLQLLILEEIEQEENKTLYGDDDSRYVFSAFELKFIETFYFLLLEFVDQKGILVYMDLWVLNTNIIICIYMLLLYENGFGFVKKTLRLDNSDNKISYFYAYIININIYNQNLFLIYIQLQFFKNYYCIQ